MKWLLWREFRRNLHLLIAGGVLALFPYAWILIDRFFENNVTAEQIVPGFIFGALISCALSQITISLLGANAIAGERADRSAEFMAYLPVARSRILAGKLTFTAIVTALIWGFNFLVVLILINRLTNRHPVTDNPYMAVLTGITGLVMFCVSWGLSSVQSSPTFAVCGGIAAPIVTLIGLLIIQLNMEINESLNVDRWFVIISIFLAAFCFSIGTWYDLKRAEP